MDDGNLLDDDVWVHDTPVWRKLRSLVEQHNIRLFNMSDTTRDVDGRRYRTIDVEEPGQPDEQLRVPVNGDVDESARQIASQLGIPLW